MAQGGNSFLTGDDSKMNQINDVVVLSAARTAIGRFGGSLKDTPLEDLGAPMSYESVYRPGWR